VVERLLIQQGDWSRACILGSSMMRPAGSQYTALACTEELAEAGVAGSIGTVGDALDNALMESTIGLPV
jgi:hypothetical protein